MNMYQCECVFECKKKKREDISYARKYDTRFFFLDTHHLEDETILSLFLYPTSLTPSFFPPLFCLHIKSYLLCLTFRLCLRRYRHESKCKETNNSKNNNWTIETNIRQEAEQKESNVLPNTTLACM